MPSDMLAEALRYAAAGLRVFPIRRGDKRPACKHGLKEATTDEKQILDWWGDGKDHGIGLRPSNGQVAVDVEAAGLEAWRDLVDPDDYPEHPIQATPGGGQHHLFSIPEGLRAVNRARVEVSGQRLAIDLRTEDGYIVVSPSLHPNGRRYEWICDARDTPIPELPRSLWCLLEPPSVEHRQPKRRLSPGAACGEVRYAAAALERECSSVAAAPEGERNAVLNRAAHSLGTLVGAGHLDDGRVRVELECAAQQAGLGLREARRTINSGLKAGSSKPREIPEPRSPSVTKEVAPDSAPVLWEAQLRRGKAKEGETQGPILATQLNVALILEFDEAWKGVLAHDEFSIRTVVLSRPPWGYAEVGDNWTFQPGAAWESVDDQRLVIWLERIYRFSISTKSAGPVVEMAARRQSFHPVREYLSGLTWDGTQRIDHWISDYLGGPESDYCSDVGAWWLTSAIARVMEPGCKADYVLILEGKQGAGKSSALRVLAGRWFDDTPVPLGTKDSFLALQGRWIVELGELDSLSRAQSSASKAFFSSPVDSFRVPYGTRVNQQPRQCVFAGSTNEGNYLRDPTGGRRYWPVKCGEVDLAALARDRDQLWAEALERYRSGARWYPVSDNEHDSCAEEQADRFVFDAWEDEVNSWCLRNPGPVLVGEVLSHALGVEIARHTKADQMRVAEILKRLGYRRERALRGGVRAYQWVR